MTAVPATPMIERWPECGDRIEGFGGVVLVCTLPMHHALDGTDWHSDGTASWRLAREWRRTDSWHDDRSRS